MHDEVSKLVGLVRIIMLVTAMSSLISCGGPIDRTGVSSSDVTSKTPMLAIVQGKNANSAPTLIKGWMRYDGKVVLLKTNYLSVMTEDGAIVCEGAFRWSGVGTTSNVSIGCYDGKMELIGKLFSKGARKQSPYKGKGFGIGMASSSTDDLFVVYGITDAERNSGNFRRLWISHGGDPRKLPNSLAN
jgi:hypothetical protein